MNLSPTAKRQKVDISSEIAVNGFNGATDVDNKADLEKPNSIPLLPRDCKTLLLDIEGCTTAISFVHDVLFPFARDHVLDYIQQLDDENSVTEILESLRQDIDALPQGHPSLDEVKLYGATAQDEILSIVNALMNHDVKATGMFYMRDNIQCFQFQMIYSYITFLEFFTRLEKFAGEDLEIRLCEWRVKRSCI